MSDRVGQQLGNYHLVRLLGHGGFAEIYLGEHIHLQTEAAIKVLHTYLTGKDKEVFHKEARTIARLVHPNIIRIFDFGIDNEVPFLAMGYAPNGTLRSRHPKGTELPLPTIVDYVWQIAHALQHAHDEHFVHCDIKPENLLVGQQGEILLSDFGIAVIAQTSRSQSMQHVAGTASYMAPEQFQGKPRPASDQYALAIMVYEWLTGTCPFHGTFVAIAGQHLLTPPPPLQRKTSTISPEVERVVMTALAKDPKQRFSSVIAFATALQQASDITDPREPSATHQPTKATDVPIATNQISESLIPTEPGTHSRSLPPSAGQMIPLPTPSSASIDTGKTAPSQSVLRQQMEQSPTQPLQQGREYQPNTLFSSPIVLSNQTSYTPSPSSLTPPTRQTVHSQPPYPVRKYPNLRISIGIFILIIVLVGSGSFFLLQGNLSSDNTIASTPTHTAGASPTTLTPTATTITVVPLAPPNFTLTGTQPYTATIQAVDKNNPNNMVTADGITCRIWLVPQGNDPGNAPGTKLTADTLAHPENFNQLFPQEVPNALIFSPSTITETQPCVRGIATWTFTISPSVVKGDYLLVGLTDWQGKDYNWRWTNLTVG